jgi:hypothetical protein
MASTSSTIRIIFDGSVRGLETAARRASAALDGLERHEKSIDKLGTAFGTITKAMAGVTAVTGGVQTVVAATGALANLAPGLLLVPGALSAAGAAFATVKIGLTGFSDAVKNGGADLAKLAPNARATAQAFRDMAPAAKEVKNAVQDELFRGLSTEVQKLGVRYLPQLKASLASIATPLNGMVRGFLDVANSEQSLNDVTTILDDTHTALSGIEPALGNVLAGFLRLAAAGTRYFAGFGTGLTDLTAKFRAWADVFTTSGGFDAALLRVGQTLQQLGRIAVNVGSALASVFKGLSADGAGGPLDSLEKLTKALADFFKTAEAQSALRELGDTFRTIADVTRTVLLEALKQLAPLLTAIGPAARAFAEAFGNTLVSVIKIVGPILTGIANVLSGMPTVVSGAATAFVLLTVAMKGATLLAGPLGLLVGAIRGLGGGGAGIGALALGLAKIGAVAGLAVVANELDKINLANAKGDPKKLDTFAASLNNIVAAGKQIASGDFAGIFADIGSEWDEMIRKFETGESDIGRIFGELRRAVEGIKLSDITFNVNTGPARASVQQLLGEINRTSPTVNINGNTNPAGFALREILREISEGKAEININGKTIPAQEALKYVIGLINNGSGEVLINGNKVPAGEALAQLLQQVDSSTAVITIDGNPVPGTNKITQTVALADGSTGTITIDGNRLPADGKINGTVTFANGSKGTITIDGNQTPANGKINATVTYANGQTGTIKVDANTAPAQSAISSFYAQWNGRTIDLRVSTAGRLAGGGPVFPGMGTFARGGAVFGPGTSTSDSIPTMLSSGEHVWTAREVRMAGGQGAVAAMRAAVRAGRIPRFAKGGANPSTTTSPTAMAAPEQPITVNVMLSQDQIAGIAQVEIARRDRATKRTVLAGSGVTF